MIISPYGSLGGPEDQSRGGDDATMAVEGEKAV